MLLLHIRQNFSALYHFATPFPVKLSKHICLAITAGFAVIRKKVLLCIGSDIIHFRFPDFLIHKPIIKKMEERQND
jgi:hypothetical protein